MLKLECLSHLDTGWIRPVISVISPLTDVLDSIASVLCFRVFSLYAGIEPAEKK